MGQKFGEQHKKETTNQCKKNDTKNEAKRFNVATFTIAKLEKQ